MRSITKAVFADRKEKGLRIEPWDIPKLKSREDKKEAAAIEAGRKPEESGVLKAT